MARLGTERALAILDSVAHDHQINRAAIMGPSRIRAITTARREFCVRAIGEGIGVKVVADILACDHSTVVYHTSARMQERKREMRAKYWSRTVAARGHLSAAQCLKL